MNDNLPKMAEQFARTFDLKQTQVLMICQWMQQNDLWSLTVMFNVKGQRMSVVVPYLPEDREGAPNSRSLAFAALKATTKEDMKDLYKRSVQQLNLEEAKAESGAGLQLHTPEVQKAPSIEVSPQEMNRLKTQDAINAQLQKDLGLDS